MLRHLERLLGYLAAIDQRNVLKPIFLCIYALAADVLLGFYTQLVEVLVGVATVFTTMYLLAELGELTYPQIYEHNHGHPVNTSTMVRCAVCAEDLVDDPDLDTKCILCDRDRQEVLGNPEKFNPYEEIEEGEAEFSNSVLRFAQNRGWITSRVKIREPDHWEKWVCPNGHYLCPDCWKSERVENEAVGTLDIDEA